MRWRYIAEMLYLAELNGAERLKNWLIRLCEDPTQLSLVKGER